jgi:EAL domain-containing protein (putative c-di-GMP-specific phosphodiesterase class I)
VQLYRPDDQRVQLRHGEMRWVERINAALDNDSFVLVAQEIRAIAAHGTAGRQSAGQRFELLLRMTASDGTWIAPMAFIPTAERYGLMPRLDRWVIAQACRELAALRAQGWHVARPALLTEIGATLPACQTSARRVSIRDTA